MRQGISVVYYAPNDIRIEKSKNISDIKNGEILVEVEACAICGSDIKISRNGNPKVIPPRVLGHEFCGHIIKTKAEDCTFKIGDRITMATTIGCGDCYYCNMGATNLCKNSGAMGFYFDGAMSNYVVIPEQAVKMGNVIPVGNLKAEIAALAEPMSCVMNSLSKVSLNVTRNAVVLGLGALGMLHAIALKEAGVNNIICVDFPGMKKSLMQKLGFETLTPDQFDVEYLSLSEGEGFDLVVITAPNNKVQCTAPKYAKKRGYVSYFASLPVSDEEIKLSSRMLHYNELFYYGTSDSTVQHVVSAIPILQKQQETLSKIVTKLPLMDFKQGVEGVLNMQYAKVVLIP